LVRSDYLPKDSELLYLAYVRGNLVKSRYKRALKMSKTTPRQHELMREARRAEEEARKKRDGTPRWTSSPQRKSVIKKLFRF
jgi:hypothetical protein